MTEDEEQYLTLFEEGDGSLYLTNGYYQHVEFGQKEREPLEYIASLQSGGILYQRPDGNWKLTYNGSYCIPLLEIFSRHVVGKQFLSRLNNVLELLGMPLAEQHPITLDGFVGFWDAEGSSDIKPSLRLVQKDRGILDIITEMFGGHVYESRTLNEFDWNLVGTRTHELVKVLTDRSHCSSKIERLKYYFFSEQAQEERRRRSKQYEAEHEEERRDYHRGHYKAHRNEIIAHQIEYQRKKREKERAIRDYIKSQGITLDAQSGELIYAQKGGDANETRGVNQTRLRETS